ncbi:hypothetical protein GQ42DRAFT_152860 [Ramicandelaber brevisporus]|nr:hypothetical protein GQ42DRAFT_152860 [Ramicandelaber brevisporus]
MKRDRSPVPEADGLVNKRPALQPPQLSLLDLPLELLEEISHYIPIVNAAKLMTVNSRFHEVFARWVWHTIGFTRYYRAELITESVWHKYGHLVRRATDSSRILQCLKLSQVVHFVHLDVSVNSLKNVITNQHIDKMQYLQDVTIENPWHNTSYSKVVGLVDSWAVNAKARGQPVVFIWTLLIYEPHQFIELCSAARMVTDANLFEFKVELLCSELVAAAKVTLPVINLTEVTATLETLARVFCKASINHLKNVRKLKVYFAQRNLYTRRRMLGLDSIVDVQKREKAVYSCTNFVGGYGLEYSEDIEMSNKVSRVFAHDTPVALTELHLDGCASDILFDNMMSHAPSVRRLILQWCSVSISYSDLAAKVPHLEYLDLRDADCMYLDSTESSSMATLSKLKELVISSNYTYSSLRDLKRVFLAFLIAGAPNLHTFRVCGYRIAQDPLCEFGGSTHQSVRSLSVFNLPTVDLITYVASWLAVFPKTKLLEIIGCRPTDVKVLKERHPSVAIIQSLTPHYCFELNPKATKPYKQS